MTRKIYSHPSVHVAQIALESMVLAGSSAPAPAGDMDIKPSIYTDDQW